ncbi:MAG: N-acetylglucosamine-6-phosphate deacetylase [Candidatus Coproplasma sp.]
MKCFKGVKAYVDGKGVVNADICFDECIISTEKAEGEEIILPEGLIVVPGFIDLHIHGAGGSDTMDASEEALERISKTVAQEGTVGFLATTMTQSEENIIKALTSVKEYDKENGARILGVHLEGPFISPEYAGAQPREYIVNPNVEQFKKYNTASGNRIKKVTVAPEEDCAEDLIKYLKYNGIIASIGHSNATAEDVKRAIVSGAESVTHTFNAQSPFKHRDIGVAGSAMLNDELSCEIIADGVHVSFDAIKFLVKNKPKDKITLITDAIRAKGLGDGESELGGQKVYVKDGQARLENGTLAGSVLKMNIAVKNMVEGVGVPFTRAIDYATKNPAKQLGIYQETGSISAGKRADFAVLDRDYNVIMTVVAGKIVYSQI